MTTTPPPSMIEKMAVVAACVLLASCDRSPLPPPSTIIEIDTQYWVCTSTHIRHHPFRRGMLTRFGRLSDHRAYDSVECDQWSATFTGKCAEDIPKNVWCQEHDAALEGK